MHLLDRLAVRAERVGAIRPAHGVALHRLQQVPAVRRLERARELADRESERHLLDRRLHLAAAEESQVAARLRRAGVVRALGGDLGELLAGEDALAQALDLRLPRGQRGRIGRRRDLDHLQMQLRGHLGELVPVCLEPRFRLGRGHGLLGEQLADQALPEQLALDVGLEALAQPGLGDVLAHELVAEPLLAAVALLGLVDGVLHLLRHVGRRHDDVLPLGLLEHELVVDQLVQHLAAERVHLRRVRVGLGALEEQEQLLFHVAREHGFVVHHGGDRIQRRLGAAGGRNGRGLGGCPRAGGVGRRGMCRSRGRGLGRRLLGNGRGLGGQHAGSRREERRERERQRESAGDARGACEQENDLRGIEHGSSAETRGRRGAAPPSVSAHRVLRIGEC